MNTVSAIVERQPIRKTRERIIESAARLFTSKGFHHTSIDDIAQHAAVAKGSIYYHFKSKDSLLVSVIEEGIRLIQETVKARLTGREDALDRLLVVIGTTYDVIVEYHALAQFALLGGCEGVSSEASARIDAARESFESYMEERMREVLEGARATPAGAALEARAAARIVVGALEGAVRAVQASQKGAHVGRRSEGLRSARGSDRRAAKGSAREQARATLLAICSRALAPAG